MDQIFIRAVQVFGTHGVLASEKLQAQLFEVDVEMFGDFSEACKFDSLSTTVDYSKIGTIVKETVENESFDLLERLADEIATRILENELLEEVEVVVRKMHPPVDFVVAHVGVRVRRTRD